MNFAGRNNDCDLELAGKIEEHLSGVYSLQVAQAHVYPVRLVFSRDFRCYFLMELSRFREVQKIMSLDTSLLLEVALIFSALKSEIQQSFQSFQKVSSTLPAKFLV